MARVRGIGVNGIHSGMLVSGEGGPLALGESCLKSIKAEEGD